MKWEKRDNCNTIEEVISRNLGIANVDEISEWDKKFRKDEYSIAFVKEACDIILKDRNRPVKIIGDYDVDGRSASMIMFLTLSRLGFNPKTRIPHRFSEGYGMNATMVDEIEDPNTLIITVDNGITAHEAIKRAKERGMTVILTDHHLPASDENGNFILPDADVIIDPNAKNGKYDFDGYCGTGIAYKLARALLKKNDPLIKSMIPYVAIATIADVMELREENYIFVKEGMDMLSKRMGPPGIHALMDVLEIQTCDSTTIGFKIAPCINAPGRMNDTDHDTLRLLVANNSLSAHPLAEKIVNENERRKELVSKNVEIAHKTLKEQNWEEGNIIITTVPGNNNGILGIIAGRLCDEYNVPVIAFSEPDADGIQHGSARSIEQVDLHALISKYEKTLLNTFGGHRQAAGLTIKKENYEPFKKALEADYRLLDVEIVEKTGFYDLEIKQEDVVRMLRKTNQYEPFGLGNEKPVFKISNFRCKDYPKAIGKNKDGVKLRGTGISAHGFGMWSLVEDDARKIPTYNIFGTLEWNEFKGRRTPEISIIDIEKCEKKQETKLAKKLKTM